VLNQTFTNNLFTFNNMAPAQGTGRVNPTAGSSEPTATTTTEPDEPVNPPNETPTNPEPNVSEGASVLRRRASLSDLSREEDIENLTIKQIKEILACNFVDYKGCCEKKELVDKTKRLYASYLDNKRLENEINQVEEASVATPSESTSTSAKKSNVDDLDLCKICMESLVDCVLLDCGHMVSCTKCGKRLAECPMCRQNIVRVIRVFKS